MGQSSGTGESPLSEVRAKRRNVYAQAARMRKWATMLENGEVERVTRLLRSHADLIITTRARRPPKGRRE